MTAPRPPRLDSSLAFLSKKLPSSPPDQFQFFSVPAPPADLTALWEADPLSSAVLWDSPLSGGWSGLGEAAVVAPRGNERFSLAGSLFPAASAHHHDAAPYASVIPPSWFGGFSFVPGSADAPPWDVFGDARFVLPRWIYRRRETGAASLTLCLAPGIQPLSAFQLAREFHPLWRILARPGESRVLPAVESLTPIPWVSWETAVTDSLAAISQGSLRKVVLAGASTVTFSKPPSSSTFLRQLAAEEPEVFRFGFRWNGRTFAGASPELLVARRGNLLSSEALAGSAPSGSDPARLMGDSKQREEHQAVVDSIRRRLAGVCGALKYPETPVIRELRHVKHLATPFEGTMTRMVNLAELAYGLHPTPAVGGVPEEAALNWIRRHEAQPRGWYAAPVGRIEAGGEGELAVALRCTILQGRRALVYAGAGIVAGSVPEAEYEELKIKTRACLQALGIDS